MCVNTTSQNELYRVTALNVTRIWIELAVWAAMVSRHNSPFPGDGVTRYSRFCKLFSESSTGIPALLPRQARGNSKKIVYQTSLYSSFWDVVMKCPIHDGASEY